MRYLIKGILHSDDEPDREFSWAVNSEEEKKKALAELAQSDCEEVTEILEITLEDCIEQEFNIMIDNARKDYLIRRCLQLSDEEYFAKKQELLEDGELFLTALKEFNKKELLMRRMKRKNVKRFMKLTMGEYLEIINQLIDAETDAEIDTILRKL